MEKYVHDTLLNENKLQKVWSYFYKKYNIYVHVDKGLEWKVWKC